MASEWAKQDILRYYHQENIEKKIIVAQFGPNMPLVNYHKELVLNETIKVLFCGYDTKRKGLDNAIDIINSCNKLDKKHHYILNVIGTDGKNTDSIKFYGKLDKTNDHDSKLFHYLFSESNFFLLPTKAECAGIVFSEAAMYGIPSLSCITGGVPSYVKDKETGFLFTINDNQSMVNEIIELSNNLKAYDEMCNNAYNYHISTLNWGKWVYTIKEAIG